MIQLTRLDRQAITVNSDLIELIEARPDTTLRLTTGQSVVVRESMDEVVERIASWRGRVLERAGLPAQLAQLPRQTLNQLAEDMIELMDRDADEARR